MINIAVVGCGFNANGHLAAIKTTPQLRLCGVADLSRERAEAAAVKFGPCRVFTDYRELLRIPGLQALVVSTHADTHHPITMAALAHGLHVLCEKPMADSVEKCEEMTAAAKQHGRLLAVNFIARSGSHYLAIKEHIDSGELGTIRAVRFVGDWSCHQWEQKERIEHFMATGGPTTDSAVHLFDAARWFTGAEFDRIDANGVCLPPYEHPQHMIASCRMSNHAIALVEVSWLYTKRTKDRAALHAISVIGDDGAAHWDNRSNALDIHTRTQTIRLTDIDKGDYFQAVHQRFAQSIQEGKLAGLADGHDGLLAMNAAQCALESARRGSHP